MGLAHPISPLLYPRMLTSVSQSRVRRTLLREGGEVPQRPVVPGDGAQNIMESVGILGRDVLSWPWVESCEQSSHSTSGGFYRP